MPGFPDSNNYYEPIHFKIEELVPKDIHSQRGALSLQLLDWKIIYSIDTVWEIANQAAGKRVRLYVNNWVWGGKSQNRGFRAPSSSVGAKLSQHRFGRAIDAVSPDVTAQWLRLKIMENNRLFPYITYMEDGVDWLHIDCRASTFKGIHLFKP